MWESKGYFCDKFWGFPPGRLKYSLCYFLSGNLEFYETLRKLEEIWRWGVGGSPAGTDLSPAGSSQRQNFQTIPEDRSKPGSAAEPTEAELHHTPVSQKPYYYYYAFLAALAALYLPLYLPSFQSNQTTPLSLKSTTTTILLMFFLQIRQHLQHLPLLR